jgi:hypothetical protein
MWSVLGGQALRSPLRLEVPYAATWHIVVDIGGAGARVGAAVMVLPAAA